MKKKFQELEPETAEQIANTLAEFRDEMRRLLEAADEKFSKFVFFTNGGGSIAALSYLGAFSKNGYAASWNISAALALFALGLVLAGVSLFASLQNFAAQHRIANLKNTKFRMNEIDVEEATPGYKSPKYWNKFHGWSENASLMLFIAGVVIGIVPVLVMSVA